MTFGSKVVAFNKLLGKSLTVPSSIVILDPFSSPSAQILSKKFYKKFYNDSDKRIFILGINPGRFGAGITGVPFTDPINLAKFCGIENSMNKRHELSSIFVYELINAFGGTEKFYTSFFIGAVCPLGFTKKGKNINYYDDKKLLRMTEPFIVSKMKEQLSFGAMREVAIILGEGKNFKYFSALNAKHNFFNSLIPLPHPRYILQYKRKQSKSYRNKYLEVLNQTLSPL